MMLTAAAGAPRLARRVVALRSALGDCREAAALPVLLAGKLPHQSTFFVNFIVLQIAFALPLDLLQLGPLCLEAIQFGCCCCFGCASSPRRRAVGRVADEDRLPLAVHLRARRPRRLGRRRLRLRRAARAAVHARLPRRRRAAVHREHAPRVRAADGRHRRSFWEAATFYESAALAIAQLLLGGMQLSKEHVRRRLLCALCFFATLVRDRTLRNHYGALGSGCRSSGSARSTTPSGAPGCATR